MQESGENYLETILVLSQEQEHVRSIDIANKLGYSKPSISRAMGILKDSKLIEMDQSGYITFTPDGKKAAENIYERHRIITAFLRDTLHISDETADQDACRIEHILSQETFGAIRVYMDKK